MEKLTREQSNRIYTTLIELLADQLGLEVEILDIRPTDGEAKIIWHV